MSTSEGDQLPAGAFHTIMDKIEADSLQIAKKWNWKCIFIHQEYLFRKILAVNSASQVREKHKDEVPNVSVSSQNIETLCKSKLISWYRRLSNYPKP